MDIDPLEIRRLLDKEAIREATLSYTRGTDRHDHDLMAAVFHPDAAVDQGTYIGDSAGFVKAKRERDDQPSRWDVHHHYITNQTIELDGDSAHVETYILSTLRRTDGLIDISGGRYIDRFERRDGRWAVADRVCLVEWNGEIAKTQGTRDPDLFVTGTWDKADPSYRRPLRVTRARRSS